MKALKTHELLSAWEQGLNQPLLQRVLIVLAAAYPGESPESLVALSIGQRDRRLLQLRARLFGPELLNTSDCPECGQKIEWQNNIANFLEPLEKETLLEHEFDLETNGYTLRFRLPNSLDIEATRNCENTHQAQQKLLSRCILDSEFDNNYCDLAELPAAVISDLIDQMERLDPQADIRLELDCPDCAHNWDGLFDISSFLYRELNDWAEGTLYAVYRLASNYGWSETEILELSAVRRQLYLGMLGE